MPPPTTLRFVRFDTGAGPRILPIENVVEVIPTVHLDETQAAGAPEYRGLLQYRGQVLPVFDLGNTTTGTYLPVDWYLVVASTDAGMFALAVSDVHHVIEVDISQCTSMDTGMGQRVDVVHLGKDILRVAGPPA